MYVLCMCCVYIYIYIYTHSVVLCASPVGLRAQRMLKPMSHTVNFHTKNCQTKNL